MELQREKEIIEKSQKDIENFGEIYKEYVNDVYRFSYSIVNNKGKAEEITQESFVRAVEKINKYEWRGTSIKSWLFGIARNVAYEGFTKKNELSEDKEIEEMGEIRYTDEGVDVKYQQDILEALNQLPTVTREIIVLRIWEGYKFKEIAEIVDKKEDSVKKQFYRGVDKLRGLLEEKGYDKSYAILPVMFKGVLQNKDKEIYRISAELIEKMLEGLIQETSQVAKLNKVNIMKNLTKEMKILVGSLCGVAIVGSMGVIWWASNREVDVNDGEVQEQDEVVSDESEDDLEDGEELDNGEATIDTVVQNDEESSDSWVVYDDTKNIYELKHPSSWNVREEEYVMDNTSYAQFMIRSVDEYIVFSYANPTINDSCRPYGLPLEDMPDIDAITVGGKETYDSFKAPKIDNGGNDTWAYHYCVEVDSNSTFKIEFSVPKEKDTDLGVQTYYDVISTIVFK